MLDHFLDQPIVCRRKLIVAKLQWVDPDGLLTFDGSRLAGDVLAKKRMQSHEHLRIVVLDRRECARRTRFDIKLFEQFAGKGLFDRLSVFDFSAGKLPVSGIYLARWPLAEEELPVIALDNGGDDIDPGA